jgi:hypothetical protein
LSNCIGVAGQVLWLDLPEPSQAQIEIVRCTFYAAEAFCVSGSIGAASLGINSRGNVFDTGFMIFDGRNPASPPLRQWVRWTENDNLYSPEQRHEQRYVVGIALKDGPARLSDWNLWWNQTGANGRQVQISYANGWNDRTAGRLRRVSSEPRDFRITKLEHVAGPPLERDQWQLFGANTGNVGPPSK